MPDDIKIRPYNIPIQHRAPRPEISGGSPSMRLKGIVKSVRKGRRDEGFNVAYLVIKVQHEEQALRTTIDKEVELVF